MRAGKLTSTIIITRRTETLDQAGTPIDAWNPVATMRAEILSSDAKTFLAEAGETIERAIVFRIRHRDGIEPGDRVTLAGRDFDLAEIKAVVPRRVTELRCTGSAS